MARGFDPHGGLIGCGLGAKVLTRLSRRNHHGPLRFSPSRFGAACLAFLVLAGAIRGLAAPGGQFTVVRADVQPALARASLAGPLAAAEGEVRAVGRDWCALWDGRGRCCFRLPAGCPVFANGRPSCLATIRPVAPGAYFWAKIWCDRNGSPAALEAIYCGGELMVLSVTGAGLTGLSPETGETVTLAVAPSCPPGRLVPGEPAYVLLDLEGRVRRVFGLGPVEQEMDSIASK